MHVDGWVGASGIYTVWTSMYKKPVPLVVSNTIQHQFSKKQHTGKGTRRRRTSEQVVISLNVAKDTTNSCLSQPIPPCFGYD